MKNILYDSVAIMTGRKWVATPFCLNYGFRSYLKDDYMDAYYSEKEGTTVLNYFGMSKQKFIHECIMKYASPTFYDKGMKFGSMKDVVRCVAVKEDNIVQMLFYGDRLRISSAWLDTSAESPNIEDYFLIYDLKLPFTVDHDILVTFCASLWKYTAEMYWNNLIMRFQKGMLKSDKLQYEGIVRFDDGVDEENGRIETFSTVKTMYINEHYAERCSEIMKLIHFVEVDEED